MINDNTRVKLAHGAHPFLRADTVIQFGTDATRTGLVTTEHAKDAAALLGVLMRPRRLGWVVEQLTSLIGAEAARSLTDDLLSYRVLVPATKPEVLLVGHGGVGTLLACAIRGQAIDRAHDQGKTPGTNPRGGNVHGFATDMSEALFGWRPMEEL